MIDNLTSLTIRGALVTEQAEFAGLPEAIDLPSPKPTRPQDARVVRAIRSQVEWTPRTLDSFVPEDHPARAVWAFLERLDLSGFYASIKAVADRPGRPATDPQVLLALWVFATVQGIGSARQLARLCEEHDAYRWIRGGTAVDYHLLADFRVDHQAAFDALLTEIVAAMMAEGLVNLEEVAQDGVRIRASAGASSFRGREALGRCLAAAQARVKELAEQRDHPDPQVSARQRAARERAAQEREERVKAAVELLPELEKIKERQRKKRGKAGERVSEARASTTDVDGRIIRMADGGYRPAYNGQLATDCASQVIVGVGVVTIGADQGQALPMEEQLAQRTGQHPRQYLIDGGFVDRDDITTLEKQGTQVYAPVPSGRGNMSENEPHRGDSPQVVAWRERMATEQAHTIYKDRAATAECVNAHLRARYNVHQFRVRRAPQVLTVLLLIAVTHNLFRWMALAR